MNVIDMPRRVDQSRCHVPAGRGSTVCVLDVGSTKVACLIAKLKPAPEEDLLTGRTHAIEVIGYGYQQSRGVKSGAIVNLDKAEHAIRRAVDAAEQMAGLTVESLIVAQTSGRLSSESFGAKVDLDTGAVREADIRRVLAASGRHQIPDGRIALHALPIGYSLDGQDGIRDPRGMVGDTLGVDVNLVTSDRSAQDNLALLINRCHLDVDAMVATPYASALASLVDDEGELGAVCVDIGGGTSSIAIFADGNLVHVDAIAIGGHHVTMDIAQGLSIRLEEAERLKTLHGSAVASGIDERAMLTIHPVGEEDGLSPIQIPRLTLNTIIRPRVDEILEMIRDRLVASGFSGRIGRRIVMTGGGSQLTGLTDVARHVFGRPVRMGRPLGVKGLPIAARGAAFSAVIGLLIYPQLAPAALFEASGRSTGTFARLGRWLRESF
ncbi:cell division protein FtsA [Acuticoccus sp. I52.16.1]|uniref:cell division protein FtsA n=1 Tax=Acuticoccus sp. I52.16.1 TaxID=2928472 RepID=UPI001FD2871D|nr:cell division protein FtsA [Acuticoccus sp. I52.16.1]UOM33617.1 cell division protein FtsA [Acuticoccus sp. I52.16.1]